MIHRSDQRGYAAVSKLLELFQSDLGAHAAIALGIIVEDGDRVLIKENGAVIRVRFLSFDFPLRLINRSTATLQAAFLHILAAEDRRGSQVVRRS